MKATACVIARTFLRSRGQQQLDFAGFAALVKDLQPLLGAVGRTA